MEILKEGIYLNPNAAPLPYCRNYKERQKIWDKIISLQNDFRNMIDNLSDEDYDNLSIELEKNHNSIIAKLHFDFKVLVHPTTKNEWFYSFLQSFDLNKEIKISDKQADIFRKYSENISEYYKNEYCGTCNGYFFELKGKYLEIYKLN